MNLMKYFTGCMVLVLCGLSGIVPVYAGESPKAGVQISPIRYDWKMKGGESRSDKIYVHNFSPDITHHVKVSVEDFYVTDDSMEAKYFVPDDAHPLKAYDVINWITVPDDFTLAPGETKELEFSITVPDGQPTSGYYGIIFFKTDADDATADTPDGKGVKIGVSYRVGALVTLAVQGDEPMRISGQLDEISALEKVFWQGPITVSARLRSDGNVHYKASGKMTIEKFGKKFAMIEIEPEVMYPGKNRLITRKTPVKWWDYGIYTVRVDMRSEDGSVTFIGESEKFVVFPWIPVCVAAGVVIVLMISVRILKKKFKIVRR